MDPNVRSEMLAWLVDCLQEGRRPHSSLDHLYAVFMTSRGRVVTRDLTVCKALDCLVNDVYLFEDFDLREARAVSVEVH